MTRWIRIVVLTLLICVPVLLLVFASASGNDYYTDLVAIIFTFLVVGGTAGAILAVMVSNASRRIVRRRRASVVLIYLDQCMRLNLPLPQMLTAAAASERGPVVRRLRALVLQLELGASITDALRLAVPETPRRTLALVDTAERIGRLPEAFNRIVAEDQVSFPENPAQHAFLRWYPAIMVFALVFVPCVLMNYVIPKFKMIFADFDVQLPRLTLGLVWLGQSITESYWIGPLILLVLAWAIVSSILDWYWPARDRSWSWSPSWFTHNRDLADVCRVVGDSLDSALPMDAALRNANDLSLRRSMRMKLSRWASGIERGMNSADAARAAGMPRLIVGLTSTGEVAGLIEAFRFLARYYSSRFSRLQQLLRGAAIPAMVFFFGTFVAVIALALFLPLVSLINVLSAYKVSP